MNILEVKDLFKTYIVNKIHNNVLKNVDFTVFEGETLFCGKNIAKMGEKELSAV